MTYLFRGYEWVLQGALRLRFAQRSVTIKKLNYVIPRESRWCHAAWSERKYFLHVMLRRVSVAERNRSSHLSPSNIRLMPTSRHSNQMLQLHCAVRSSVQHDKKNKIKSSCPWHKSIHDNFLYFGDRIKILCKHNVTITHQYFFTGLSAYYYWQYSSLVGMRIIYWKISLPHQNQDLKPCAQNCLGGLDFISLWV